MNEDNCFPLTLSQRECSALYADIQIAGSKTVVADILDWYALSEDDFTMAFPDLAKAVQDLPDESSPTL
ncbi:hypothetical protein ABTX83_02260 [Streptomyces werraensis]|uniref:hypothetical protein n=1 Tax=Streptomyces werraensis TaxID=68284 RepID=UPI00332D6B7F|nr:hypothetical protein [Streptomyces werraensis]